jgi:putative membrane protein
MSVTEVMNRKLFGKAAALAMLIGAPSLMAAPTDSIPTWHAQTLPQALGNMLLFALIGIATAILGYKLFDKCTPGDLTKEIIQHRNVAAAIIGAAVILGVCIIIAASMLG